MWRSKINFGGVTGAMTWSECSKRNERRELSDTKDRQAFPGILLKGTREIGCSYIRLWGQIILFRVREEDGQCNSLYADGNNQVQNKIDAAKRRKNFWRNILGRMHVVYKGWGLLLIRVGQFIWERQSSWTHMLVSRYMW